MKKQFKVQLFTHENWVVEQLILAAARSNSEFAPVDLKTLKGVGEGMVEQFPNLSKTSLTFELIDNRLHIDFRGLHGWEQAAIIEEVEIFEPVFEEEKEGII